MEGPVNPIFKISSRADVQKLVGRMSRSGMVAKPGNGLMRVCCPVELLGPSERAMLNAKLGLLEEAKKLHILSPDVKPKDLGKPLEEFVKALFPGAGHMYLLRNSGMYQIVSSANLAFNPQHLDISSADSLVSMACESNYMLRRTVYLINTQVPHVFLENKALIYIYNAREYAPSLHHLEEGPIDQCGFKIDLKKLAKIGIRSIAVAPIMRSGNDEDVQGALILVGPKGFLNPFIDLIVLRELADYLAETICQNLKK